MRNAVPPDAPVPLRAPRNGTDAPTQEVIVAFDRAHLFTAAGKRFLEQWLADNPMRKRIGILRRRSPKEVPIGG